MSAYKGKYKGKEIDDSLDHISEADEAMAVALASLDERLRTTQLATSAALASIDERVNTIISTS